jgi:5-methylcytosine-specific restriction endonuclease McrA
VSDLYLHSPNGVLAPSRSKNGYNDLQKPQQHVHYQQLDRYPALVLNADYQPLSYLPLSLWHWQDAIKAVFSSKVTVIDVYDISVRAVNLEIPLPSVIALHEYIPPLFEQTPSFTKRNVFLRDEYKCQYCRRRFHTRDLSLDHVVPRCRGGRLQWTNAVTSCHACNGRKGNLMLQELKQVGMKLHKAPFVPTQYELAVRAGKLLLPRRRHHPTWEPYLTIGGVGVSSLENDEEKSQAAM